MGLCLSGLVFFAGTSREGFGLPTRSRAISRTTLAAEKIFFLRLRGMGRDAGFRNLQAFAKKTGHTL